MINHNDWNNIENYYTGNHLDYGVNPNVRETVKMYPNLDFPNYYNIYNSTVIEFWKIVTPNEVPYVEENRYLISSWGNTWDCLYNKPITSVCSAGNKFYIQLNIRLNNNSYRTVKLHRLVMMLFSPIENPDNYQINHIDCSHDQNYLYNLEWCDDSYNRLHSIINGVGTNIFNSEIVILTPEEVHQMKVLREDKGYTYRQIYNEMNLQTKGDFERIRKTIERISHGKSKLYSRYYY